MTRTSNEMLVEKSGGTLAGFTAMLVLRARRGLQRAFGWTGRVNGEPRMELLETLQLGGKRQLMLVRCNGQGFLVGAGGESIQTIIEVRPQPAAATCLPLATGDSFSESQPAPARGHAESQREHVC
jgi:flagellar biogenesis protein FliO